MRSRTVKRPMLFSAVAAVLLIVIACRFNQAMLSFGASLLILAFLLLKRRVRGARIVSAAAILLVILSVGRVNTQLAAVRQISGTTAAAYVTLLEDPPSEYGEYNVSVRVDRSETLPQGIGLWVTLSDRGLRMGDRLAVTLQPEEIDESYSFTFYSDGVYAAASVSSAYKIGTDPLLFTAGRIRRYITGNLFSNLRYSEAATAAAVLIGDRSHLSDDFVTAVRAAGVSHVMVVSGMHLAIIMSGLFGLLDRCRYNRYLRAAVSLAAIILITAVCGFTMSIIRAGLTYLLAVCAILLDRDNDPLNTLGAAVTVILAVTPMALFNISFQLSVLATFGILVVSPALQRLVDREERLKNRILRDLFTTLTGSLSAMLTTMPVVIYYFGKVSLVAPLTNLLISYAVTGMLLLSIVCTVIGLLPFGGWIARPFYVLLGWIIRYVNAVITCFGGLPHAAVPVPDAAVPVVTAVIFLVCAVIWACKRRRYLLELRCINAKEARHGGNC